MVLRRSADSGSWSAFFLREGHVPMVLAVNRYQDLSTARQLIARRVPVAAEQPADEWQERRALARRGAQV